MSDESEIIAMKSVGLSMSTLILPALVLSFLVSWASAQTSFNVAPWGNRQFEVLVHNLGSQKAAGVIRPGTFSEGFFSGLVIYAGKADAKTGLLEEIFIYDERSRSTPLTIIAERGQILRQTDSAAQRASLRLINGNVHRIHEGRHTKIKFTTYDILLSSPVSTSIRQQSPQSMTLEELAQVLRDPTLDSAKKIRLEIEYHRRWALCFACFIFGGLGVGLGTRGNRRSGKSSGFVMSLMIIVGYWILHATFEGLAKSQTFTPALAMWSPNIVFGTLTTMLLKKGWNF